MLVMILPWLILVFQYKSRDQPLSVSLVYKSSQLGVRVRNWVGKFDSKIFDMLFQIILW